MDTVVYDRWAYSSTPGINWETMMNTYNINMYRFMEICTPRTPVNSGTHIPTKQRTKFESQRINYKKNYAFYDSYISKCYIRKKVLNELHNYFATKSQAVIYNNNKPTDNDRYHKSTIINNKRPKRKQKRKNKYGNTTNVSINELWVKKKKNGKSLNSIQPDEHKDNSNQIDVLSNDHDSNNNVDEFEDKLTHKTNEYEKHCDGKMILLLLIFQLKIILMMQTNTC